MTEKLTCITPVGGSVYVEQPLASAEISTAPSTWRRAQAAWRRVPIAERQVRSTSDRRPGREQGRHRRGDRLADGPQRQAGGEVVGFEERARHMAAIAPEVLGDIDIGRRRASTASSAAIPWAWSSWSRPGTPPGRGQFGGAGLAGNAVLPSTRTRRRSAPARRGLRGYRPARGRLPAPHLGRSAALRSSRAASTSSPSPARSRAASHQRAAARRFIGVGLELTARTRLVPTPKSSMRSRTWSAAPSSTPASPAAASSASTCEVYDHFVEGALAEA